MSNSVIIKGNKYGIVVVLDSEIEFEELKINFTDKLVESAKFFGNAKMAISFEGRVLSTDEQRELLDLISNNTELSIACIIENDTEKEQLFKKSLDEKLMELTSNTGQFYKGNLRSGQVLEVETSIIIIGDVKPGARVVSKGNVVILGALKGTVFAGATGNENSFVVALDMSPMQIRIGDTIARSPDNPVVETIKQAKIAFMEDGNIYIEPINREVLNDINL